MDVNEAGNVTQLTVRVANPPLAVPHATAGGMVASFPMVLLDMATSAGLTGRAYVFTYSMVFAPAVARLLADLTPLLTGQPCAPRELQALLRKRLRLIGAHGFTMMALAAIDMAAWDAVAQAARMPLYRLLGATRRGTLAYGPVGMSGVEGAAREAAASQAVGLLPVKAKIGYASVPEDVAVVEALRRATGASGTATVMVDYNQSLSPVQAIERGRVLDALGLGWIEEPTVAEDYSGLAQVAMALRTPVQAGENWWGPLEFRKAIEARATDLLMPDAMKVGGVSGWLDVAALADAAALPVSSHLFPEVSAHLLAATPTAHWLEWTDWSSPVIATPPEVRDGRVWPSEEPGIGVRWDEDAVARWQVR
jgi:mandelate racemase